MHRFHLSVCRHFQQDPESVVKVHIAGYEDILNIYPKGAVFINGIKSSTANLIIKYGLGNDTTIEQLIHFIEDKGSILIKLKPPGVVICHSTQKTV